MFRDGQYLEVIKASDNCLATAVVTVQEKTVEIKRRKVITNKWLQVEDWAALYKILERAVLRNGRGGDGSHREGRGCEWKKSTRQLEVTYTFDPPECASDATSLPTIKVHVSPARKKLVKRETSEEGALKGNKADLDDGDSATKRTKEERSPHQTSDIKKTPEKPVSPPKKPEISRTIAMMEHENFTKRKRNRKYTLSDDSENASEELEEYIPDAPNATGLFPDFKYVPSRKSALENMRLTSNEYTPTLCADSKRAMDDVATSYVPNSIEQLEMYEPCATTMIPESILEEYVPNSKGIKPSIEEYEPDFKSPSKLMKFDDSYVPSSVRQSGSQNVTRRTPDKPDRLKMQRLEARRKGTPTKKKIDELFS
ncbi:muscle M-line assembly protein unc-89-like [Odontomachus brunneus]|uniref:muscle M-line assembly protein unc-89-like n=1 Tax=Odontomachus brunneus TaxID=486640 RepID=UPI0013F1CFD2|nr:muscle M-line assembly protein unc-89-like [Odontomachus brunneus]